MNRNLMAKAIVSIIDKLLKKNHNDNIFKKETYYNNLTFCYCIYYFFSLCLQW